MSILVICGATATGKSDLAISLAQHFDGEIINADSMQIYRGMDIGTAKLTLEQRQGVPHHLLDVLDVTQDSTVAWYQDYARKVINEIESRGKRPIIVGGTGLYIKSILDELNFPDTDPDTRKALELELEKIGLDAMYERLQKLDPAAAIAIDRANARRVIRALEVIAITGKPFTANLPREESTRYPDARQFGLVMDRESLDVRISARVDLMWEQGFVSEVQGLLDSGITEARTAQLALGYSQIIAYLQGRMTQDEAREDTKRATRQYARRQETWFSRDARITWISPVQPRFETVLKHLEKIN
ncbi:MAG: tRNA (adenosine(37)-N6)-dimethylallyltransferase MiaA [Actinobacteria bacterium]|jgi:tRNA dimethylallyltransferase|uniref:tRNA dimethylallyltransferase n=1 Tax=freshwater metagenome TaxID=449393 RepID=A0A6J7VCB5_9ZZZZ|nr:tRNA (adenosine(37)-N6)-dimethylallyltransferase MiaA [Actinomycetota bacterium]MSY35590.1 tRNA (adenosine(37)-N6)-dimethylallyltransferase MiaA [Actinomycetota bacterium]MTA72589.1 tRNA (adenosine(37)-N6)-dimethylallyltransferase MiaA [Actinomycetota bacterium]MTB29163.1 tRNA (adenosine(37)-N6)-dimethylallyltransferase MiaA [Actinomycetota bacterium]MUH48899.1 tRNA (adenosine(37)-N6)-dimethylallyltransferase MiaA [Actinomycetota bacterium]